MGKGEGNYLHILFAVAVTVSEVNQQTDGAPEPEAFPGHGRQIIHDIGAAGDREGAHDVDGRAAERPVDVRIFPAHNHDAD